MSEQVFCNIIPDASLFFDYITDEFAMKEGERIQISRDAELMKEFLDSELEGSVRVKVIGSLNDGARLSEKIFRSQDIDLLVSPLDFSRFLENGRSFIDYVTDRLSKWRGDKRFNVNPGTAFCEIIFNSRKFEIVIALAHEDEEGGNGYAPILLHYDHFGRDPSRFNERIDAQGSISPAESDPHPGRPHMVFARPFWFESIIRSFSETNAALTIRLILLIKYINIIHRIGMSSHDIKLLVVFSMIQNEEIVGDYSSFLQLSSAVFSSSQFMEDPIFAEYSHFLSSPLSLISAATVADEMGDVPASLALLLLLFKNAENVLRAARQ